MRCRLGKAFENYLILGSRCSWKNHLTVSVRFRWRQVPTFISAEVSELSKLKSRRRFEFQNFNLACKFVQSFSFLLGLRCLRCNLPGLCRLFDFGIKNLLLSLHFVTSILSHSHRRPLPLQSSEDRIDGVHSFQVCHTFHHFVFFYRRTETSLGENLLRVGEKNFRMIILGLLTLCSLRESMIW